MIADPIVLTIVGVFGAMFGSFLNVCIARLPTDESIVSPRSKCPGCEKPIAWYDNVPVASWLVLGGKCRHCKERISIQYPLVELAVAAIWVGSAWYYGLNLQGLAAALFGTILLGIGVTDAKTYLIPNEYTYGGLILGLLFAATRGWDPLLTALVGAAVGFFLLLFVAWAGEKAFGEEAMGGGDIKMMAMVGAFVGWKGVLLTVFGGALLGSVIFVPLSLGKKRLVPFGIFLAAAAGITFVVGNRLIDWYVRTMIG